MGEPPCCSLMDGGRVQDAAEPVPQQGEEGHRGHQHEAGEKGQPPLAGGEVAHALGEDDPNGGLFRGEAEAQKGDAGLVEDGVGEEEDESSETENPEVQEANAEESKE